MVQALPSTMPSRLASVALTIEKELTWLKAQHTSVSARLGALRVQMDLLESLSNRIARRAARERAAPAA